MIPDLHASSIINLGHALFATFASIIKSVKRAARDQRVNTLDVQVSHMNQPGLSEDLGPVYRLVFAIYAATGMNPFGGHYFSALTTARELSKKHLVSITVIGDFLPPTLDVDDIDISFVKYNPGALRIAPREIGEALAKTSPDIVVAFDVKAGYITRAYAAIHNMGFIQVKAGGPVPRTPYIKNPHQVHFSKKDHSWANERISYCNKQIVWIPNRIIDETPDHVAINNLRDKLGITYTDIVLIRIGRVDRNYERAFLAAVNSASLLRAHGYSVRLIMIGAVAHQEVCDRIAQVASDGDVLLTDEQYIRNARRFLDIAHINLGVGRGFMEGCAAGNYMLAMAGDSSLPVTVSEDNFHELFEENFSLRGKSDKTDCQRTIELLDVAKTISAGSTRAALSRYWFETYFDSKKLLSSYEPILDSAAKNRERLDHNVLFEAIVFLVQRAIHRFR